MNAVTTVAAALKRATLKTDDGDLVLDFPGGERLRLKTQATRLSTDGDVTDREPIPLNTEVDFDDNGSWWRATPDGTADAAPGIEELLEIEIDPHLENVGDVDYGEGIESDGGWPVSDAVDHGDYEPLDMANNIDDERVRQRIAWIDGMGRAYAHSLDSQDTKPLADRGEIPPEEDVILNPSNGSEIAGHADHEAFSVFRFGAGDLVDIHLSCGECGTRWIIEDVPKEVAESPGDYLDSEGDR
ncbi:hypothetical protein DVK02_12735 [Halobellus sp. Atlit-31R]|nr:hypothetical protein DVK02_12735 [Halobellus sp. Atlit-31R]